MDALMICIACELPALWIPPEGMPPTLSDLVCRLPEDSPAWEPCPITWAHEASHFLSKGGHGIHGIYWMDGQRRWVPIPPISTERVFRAIPIEKRGSIYRTYLTQGMDAYWRDRPTMILDEWVAYLRGSQVRKELAWTRRKETTTYCAVCADWAQVLYQMSLSIEGYNHAALRDVCREIVAECREAIPEWDEMSDAKF